MSETFAVPAAKAPWHFWVVGVLALLWYLSGTYVIQMAQLNRLPDLTPDEIAYYAAKPGWKIVLTAITTYGSVIATVLLLMRRRAAVWAFDIALAFILLGTGIELADGTSRAYANNAAAIATTVIVVIAILMPLYARAMNRRGVLR